MQFGIVISTIFHHVLVILAFCEAGGGGTEAPIEDLMNVVPRQSDNSGNRAGRAASPEELESCNNLALREIKEGVYFGDLRLRWRAASECCEIKGKSLLTYPERHLAAIGPYTPAGPNDFLNMLWVGGHDAFKEGTYYWVSGEWIRVERPPFRVIYGSPDRNCIVVGSEGLLIDIQCDHRLKFFCQDVGKEPTAEDLEICKTIEFESDGSRFKRQKTFPKFPARSTLVTQPIAKACCAVQGWKLASLNDLSNEGERKLRELVDSARILVGFWTSGTNKPLSQTYTWDSQDDVIPANFPLWGSGYPQSIFKGRRCVQVTHIDKMYLWDASCDYTGAILCQEEDGCVATDTAKILTKPGPNRFEFRSNATMAEKIEIGGSLARHLSPSQSTRLNWTAVWERYSQPEGESPVEFDPADLATPEQNSACIASFIAYKEYVATCNETIVAYVEPVVVTAENVSELCATPNDCVASPCTACDCWVLVATHNTFISNPQLTTDVDPSLASRARDDIAPKSCFDFQPHLDYNDFTNALLTKEFVTALNPSPTTGLDWSEFYGNVTSGIQTERYVVRKGDVPAGSFMNIYKVKGTCGDYTTILPVFKKVLFKTEDAMGNCEIAREENVPLAGC